MGLIQFLLLSYSRRASIMSRTRCVGESLLPRVTSPCADVGSNMGHPEFTPTVGVHANGEAMVIKNGQIVFFTVLGKEKTGILDRCGELLHAYEQY